MKRLLTVVSTLFMLIPVLAYAQHDATPSHHNDLGLGFHTTEAPVGLRWWMSGQKVGFDVGLGFGSDQAPGYPDEKITNWTIDFGVPFVMQSWEKLHVLFRPGLTYHSQQEVITSLPTAFNTDDETSFSLTAEIEGEFFLADNASVSASHGIEFNSRNPVGPGDTITSFSTIGRNFTQVGFHLYFLGGEHR